MIRLAKFVGVPLLLWETKSTAFESALFRYEVVAPNTASWLPLEFSTLKFDVHIGPQMARAKLLRSVASSRYDASRVYVVTVRTRNT